MDDMQVIEEGNEAKTFWGFLGGRDDYGSLLRSMSLQILLTRL